MYIFVISLKVSLNSKVFSLRLNCIKCRMSDHSTIIIVNWAIDYSVDDFIEVLLVY